MENNGKGLFYGVIGVATLIVAIIGATFAYFNASKTASDIQGEANNTLKSDLSLTVTKVQWNTDAETVASDKLVPADFKTLEELNTDQVNAALTKKCIDGGFTGCHVWKITASSSQYLEAANIHLDLKVTGDELASQSKYSFVVFTGSETPENGKVDTLTASTVEENDTFNSISGLGTEIYRGALDNSSNKKTYYVMIYYANEESDQTSQVEGEKGQYTGTVTLNAAGTGQVTADFTQE